MMQLRWHWQVMVCLRAAKNSPLESPALFNSELLLQALREICTNAIWYMQTFELRTLENFMGWCCWYGHRNIL